MLSFRFLAAPQRHVGRTVALVAAVAIIGISAQSSQAQNILRVAVPDVPSGRGNPYVAQTFGSPLIFFMNAMYDGLTMVGEDGVAVPRLAANWKNINRTTWQFTLRSDMTFSNGKPVNAQAIVKNLEVVLSEYGQGQNIANQVRSLGGARAIDNLTVEVTTKQPNPVFDKEIGGLPIFEPDYFKDVGVDGFANAPVTTGSYKIDGTADWGAESVRFVPHAGSWHPGKVPALLIAEIPERAARVQALESGQMDVVVGLNMDAFEPIEAAGHRMYSAPAPVVYGIPLMSENRPNSPFRDVRVRRAVNYALNKESMNENLLRGRAWPSSQPATRNTFGYNPDVKPYPYDPEKAKQLLTEAGFPNGFKTRMEAVMSGSQTADAEIYQQVAIDLARVGIEVEVIPLRFADWLKKWLPGKEATTLGFSEMFGLGYFLVPEIDAVRAFVNHWCDKKPQWYCNESLRPLVEQARTEFDTDKRRKVLQELMKLSHDDAPVLFTVDQIDVVGLNERVQNFSMINRFINYDGITISN